MVSEFNSKHKRDNNIQHDTLNCMVTKTKFKHKLNKRTIKLQLNQINHVEDFSTLLPPFIIVEK